VLSGFLITGILIGGRELGDRRPQCRLLFIRQFYIRRFSGSPRSANDLVPVVFSTAASGLGIEYHDSGIGNFVASSLATFASRRSLGTCSTLG
jgi:hypothetical protein